MLAIVKPGLKHHLGGDTFAFEGEEVDLTEDQCYAWRDKFTPKLERDQQAVNERVLNEGRRTSAARRSVEVREEAERKQRVAVEEDEKRRAEEKNKK